MCFIFDPTMQITINGFMKLPTTLNSYCLLFINEEAIDGIAAVLSHNTDLQGLYLCGNNLKSASAIKTAKVYRQF